MLKEKNISYQKVLDIYKNTNITRITMPTSLRKIGVNAFYDCKQLMEILDIPIEIAEVEKIINSNGKCIVNPSCRMSDGVVIDLSALIYRYPRKKK